MDTPNVNLVDAFKEMVKECEDNYPDYNDPFMLHSFSDLKKIIEEELPFDHKKHGSRRAYDMLLDRLPVFFKLRNMVSEVCDKHIPELVDASDEVLFNDATHLHVNFDETSFTNKTVAAIKKALAVE